MAAALPPGDPESAARAEGSPAGVRAERDPERRRALLEARARALADAREAPRTEGIPVLAFHVGGRALAVEVSAVGQVVEARGVWPLPASPAWLLGALVARTRIVPVLDLRPMLGLPAHGTAQLRRAVVLEWGGEAYAIAVERFDGRRDVPSDQVVPPGPGPFKWATADGTSVLDLDGLAPPPDRVG
ncbi:MAG TPA: chemotaxis protein CheW [Anaeromyxobacteraceae bacterium]|nr:chemotaxis protein CheW [Anaeromyxobacteraceae bacterium]